MGGNSAYIYTCSAGQLATFLFVLPRQERCVDKFQDKDATN